MPRVKPPATRKPGKPPPRKKKRPPGRPTDYGPRILRAAETYLTGKGKKSYRAFPSVAGFARVLGLARETLHAWGRDETKPEFSHILRRIASDQEAELLERGGLGILNSTIAKLVLARHGYVTVTTHELSGRAGGAPIAATVVAAEITSDMDPAEAVRLYQQLMRPDAE